MSDTRDRTVFVPAGRGGAVLAGAGELLAVVDVEGSQVADFVAIQRDDPRQAVSSCPMDPSPINGGRITPIQLVAGPAAGD